MLTADVCYVDIKYLFSKLYVKNVKKQQELYTTKYSPRGTIMLNTFDIFLDITFRIIFEINEIIRKCKHVKLIDSDYQLPKYDQWIYDFHRKRKYNRNGWITNNKYVLSELWKYLSMKERNMEQWKALYEAYGLVTKRRDHDDVKRKQLMRQFVNNSHIAQSNLNNELIQRCYEYILSTIRHDNKYFTSPGDLTICISNKIISKSVFGINIETYNYNGVSKTTSKYFDDVCYISPVKKYPLIAYYNLVENECIGNVIVDIIPFISMSLFLDNNLHDLYINNTMNTDFKELNVCNWRLQPLDNQYYVDNIHEIIKIINNNVSTFFVE